jgi:hypothetical protein
MRVYMIEWRPHHCPQPWDERKEEHKVEHKVERKVERKEEAAAV